MLIGKWHINVSSFKKKKDSLKAQIEKDGRKRIGTRVRQENQKMKVNHVFLRGLSFQRNSGAALVGV